DRYREPFLRFILADHVGVEELVDLARLREAVPLQFGRLGEFFLDDLVAQVDAFIADVHSWARDKLLDLLLALATERALQQVTTVAHACHPATPLPGAAGLTASGERLLSTILGLNLDGTAPAAQVVAQETCCRRAGARPGPVKKTLPRSCASGSSEPHPPGRNPWPPRP